MTGKPGRPDTESQAHEHQPVPEPGDGYAERFAREHARGLHWNSSGSRTSSPKSPVT